MQTATMLMALAMSQVFGGAVEDAPPSPAGLVYGAETPEWLLRPRPAWLPQDGSWTSPGVWTATVVETVRVPAGTVDVQVCYGNGCRIERRTTYRTETRTVRKSWRVGGPESAKPAVTPTPPKQQPTPTPQPSTTTPPRQPVRQPQQPLRAGDIAMPASVRSPPQSRGSLAHQGSHYDWPGFPSLDALERHLAGSPHNIDASGMSNEQMLAAHDGWHVSNESGGGVVGRGRRWRRR